jgi:hypothetical protein
MDNEAPALLPIGDETDAGLCVDGVCIVPPTSKQQDAEVTSED